MAKVKVPVQVAKRLKDLVAKEAAVARRAKLVKRLKVLEKEIKQADKLYHKLEAEASKFDDMWETIDRVMWSLDELPHKLRNSAEAKALRKLFAPWTKDFSETPAGRVMERQEQILAKLDDEMQDIRNELLAG